MYLRPALKFVELIASISTEDEMINCASTPAPWEVPFKLRVDCNTANTLGGWWRTGSAGSASRAQQWVLLPSHPCGYILELWNVLPATSRGRRYPTGYRNEGSGNYRYEYTAISEVRHRAAHDGGGRGGTPNRTSTSTSPSPRKHRNH